MNLLKIWILMLFSIGMAIATKYYAFSPWIEEMTWIALPMIVVGAIGICLLWGKED